jgi:acyl-CoA dehydrogenase
MNMDFNLSQEQELLKKSVQEFALKEVKPKASKLDEEGEFPRDIVKRMAEFGLLGTVFPEEYGGSPIGHLARVITIEEISKVCASLGLFLQATPLGLWVILKFGNEEQKKQYIPPVLRGEKIMCMAVTEPTGGSDPAAIFTRAKLDGNEYIINGSKCWITNGGIADLCVFIARTGTCAEGLSAFIIEKNTKGFKVGTREKHAGLRAMDISELVFENCRLSKENLIGKEGDGLKAGLTAISEIGRPGNAAVALGIAEASFEAALEFAKSRILYGKPLINLQAVQFMLSEIYANIEAARWLSYHAAWLLDQGKRGKEITKEIAVAKMYSSEVAVETATKAIKLHGAYGTSAEFNVIRYLRDALETMAAAGTNEVMKVIIGKEMASGNSRYF